MAWAAEEPHQQGYTTSAMGRLAEGKMWMFEGLASSRAWTTRIVPVRVQVG